MRPKHDDATRLGKIDLVGSVPGDETEQVEYKTGCQEAVDAALWTIEGGSHIPFFYQMGDTVFADLATDWLLRLSR